MIPVPAQLYVTPVVVELAEIIPLVAAQVNSNGEPGVTLGGVVLFVTVTVAVFKQPFEGSATVTVYVPGAFTVGDELVPPAVIPAPVQLYVAPAVEEFALIAPLVVVQFNVNGGPAVTFGKAPLTVTFTVVVFVQLFTGLVTVTVYVPAAFTVAEEVAPPETILGPTQL